jgi:hypothetical protein
MRVRTVIIPALFSHVLAFVPHIIKHGNLPVTNTQIYSETPARLTAEEEAAIQWDTFVKYQARGKWRGTWTTYDYMGDVLDTTTASVNLILDPEKNQVVHTHDMVVGSASSDCKTCFDSDSIKKIPVGTYSPGNLNKYRCGSVGMVCGPTLTRSGSMSTELVLAHGNGRVRVIFQHAPVWEQGVEPGSCPPQALKLFRTMVSREVLENSNDIDGPPTTETEKTNPPTRGNPKFFRPVPPYLWHKRWAGSSWTWGQQSGDRGWSIAELEEADAWHGRPTGDTSDVWAMRLPGILLQAPRVITTGRAGICRLAWLAEDDAPEGSADDGSTAVLLRTEASVVALEPVIDEENEVMLGFYPPELGSYRCDVLMKIGELENVSMLSKLRSMGEMDEQDESYLKPSSNLQSPQQTDTTISSSSPLESNSNASSSISKAPTVEDKTQPSERTKDKEPPMDDSGLQAIRNALKL